MVKQLEYMVRNQTTNQYVRERMKNGTFKSIDVDLEPTEDFGYVCGLTLGDGSIVKTKTRNYFVYFCTTRRFYARFIIDIFQRFCKSLHPYIKTREKTRSFPNGTKRTDIIYEVIVNSKVLYMELKPYKKNYLWSIPQRIMGKKEAELGFLSGIFDADGTVQKRCLCQRTYIRKKSRQSTKFEVSQAGSIQLTSKFMQNILIIRNLLNKHHIQCKVYPRYKNNQPSLHINKKQDKEKFVRLVGFRLDYKQQALIEDIEEYMR